MKHSYTYYGDRLSDLIQLIVALVTLTFCLPQVAFAQNSAPPSKKRLAVGPIIAIKAIEQKALKANQADALHQALETLDTTLIDQINASRKFEVVARKDALKSIQQEQDFGASGFVDQSTAAEMMKISGAQYLVLTTITDFAIGSESVKFEGIGVAAKRESVRISCSIQIYDATTGKLLESAKFRGQESNSAREGSPTADGATLTKITDSLSANILNRIVDVIYPAKVAAKLGTQITINRGEGAGVSLGQLWSVYALGDQIVDPDTGEKLGGNEAEVGQFKITRITAKLSYGDALEDNGITVGNITRPKQVEAPVNPTTKPQTKSLAEKAKDDF